MRRFAAAALSAVLAGGVSADGHAQEPSGGAPGTAGGPRPGMERLARAIERGLALDDAQGARLREVSARYAGRRQALVADERAARRTLREELSRGDTADQPRVAAALTSLLEAQRRRVALVDSEQRELAAFLTPVQRARFLALQERALRAAQRVRLQREAGGPDGPRHGPRPYR